MKPIRFGIFFFVTVMITQYACLPMSPQKQAEKLIQEKDYQSAVDVCQALIDSKPGTPDARKAQLAVGKLYIDKMNQPEAGMKVYQDLIAAASDSEEAAEAHWRLGIYYFKTEDYESAQRSFDTIVNQFSQLELSHNAQLMLAKSYESDRHYEKATEIYDNVANRHPDGKRAVQALTNKARIQRTYLKDEKEAKRIYQSLVKRYGKVEGTEEAIEDAKQELRLMGASIPKPDDPLATQYDRLMEQRRKRRERDRPRGGVELNPVMVDYSAADSGFGISAEEVMKAFGRIQIDHQGTYYDAVLMIANFNFQSENYRNAGALYYRGFELAKQDKAQIDPYHYLRLSICYRKLGLHQRAREELKKAISKDRQILESVITTATTQYSDGDYKKAIATYNSVLGLNPSKDAELYWKIGLVYKKMKDVEKEREYFERAIAVKTDYTDALQSLAEVLYYRLDDGARGEIFQNLVDAQGDTFVVEKNYASEKALGDICYKYGNYPRAKSKYETAARIAQWGKRDTTSRFKKRILNNQIVYATVHAAMAAYRDGMEDQAQEIVETLAAEYPDHPLIPYGRGQLATLKGDADAAVIAFKASMEKDPHSYAAPLALGEYYLSQGFEDEAVALWEEFLKTNRSHHIEHRLKAVKSHMKR